MRSTCAGLPKLLYIKVRTASGVVLRELDAMGRLKERPPPGHRIPHGIPRNVPGVAKKPQPIESTQPSMAGLPPPDVVPAPDILSLAEFVTFDEDFLAKLEPVPPFQWESWDARSDDICCWS
jgi:hypothetical protein